MRAADDADFREFARARSGALRRTAYLLCGDWHLAEDLVQVTLIKLYRVWPKVARRGPVDNYARQVLLRCWLDEQRRPWRRRERRDGVVPDQPSSPPEAGISDPLLRALAEVPPKQRAAVVLRYCADLPAAQVADVLRCSEGTVRSQAARGLETLRGVLEHSSERSA
ncbi:SigE family RNA polymerase sigma factor [Amycolatopsis sp. NPDC058278]|jgi:RNA polymerase sigma-70 factor (sigma-E family)|uniref:SigE family RNA polymerase sigma factor n=1 Tax=unclassified Amycolatopsis TaxID=2618356 RepID=UPI00255BF93A|nr:SigE family RNA polymerase sigma factor [Amycolatopsis sp. DG1A-15b]WIX88526.1 SigE family RNA polymerase sigma factor [Amycolatopsis sp. DG1A-15b]